ncbi:hypothetical protein PPL_10805 [Heterostelium album PN500]|uniref:Uncharacterized protein n=1 Tax=Heterostelium pallidum (strain ATCC 26659 / Pp 5 / PN500) TaxID=670386 RepID=D3BS13_HETP5|nr:hypothetical protein PPL_10805 [Heterostelium album PN500]EFA75750.1 hypothetical protein PPL_10805 [Heterostelium album PN500]|eukprot:XP_020427884.1 hypothetical protein PPL_10805 [Heterostelium album PN500]
MICFLNAKKIGKTNQDVKPVYINREVYGANNILLAGMRQFERPLNKNGSRFTLLMAKRGESTTAISIV